MVILRMDMVYRLSWSRLKLQVPRSIVRFGISTQPTGGIIRYLKVSSPESSHKHSSSFFFFHPKVIAHASCAHFAHLDYSKRSPISAIERRHSAQCSDLLTHVCFSGNIMGNQLDYCAC